MFFAQGLSSFGDWIALFAILALVKRITDNEFAVAAMLVARLGPALIFGPLAGVIVDRWNRKRVMVASDLARGGLIVVLPFIESIGRVVGLHPVVLLFIISAILEMLTLLWAPAKDAALPGLVPRERLTDANGLVAIAAYATFPFAGAAFGLLAVLGRWMGATFDIFREFQFNQEHLAFFLDGATFAVSALIIATIRFPAIPRQKKSLRMRRVLADLSEGIRGIWGHQMIRPWVLGIGMIYVGVGIFIALSVFYVSDVLGAESGGFGLLITAVGAGLGFGFIFSGVIARVIPRDIFFSSVVFALGVSLFAFGSISTLPTGTFIGALVGLFGGLAYPAGLALMQEHAADDMRGRTLASLHSLIRLAVVGSLAAAPVLSKLIDQFFQASDPLLFGQEIDIRGARVVLWVGGISILLASAVTTNAVRARWRGALHTPGIFLVFEGGEGTGKTTQIEKLKTFLESRGRDVVVTREPGGTKIGERIRDVLLDPLVTEMGARTEALLYAADRAQHVKEVIRPELEVGKIVISDRYIDSSLAYQGMARNLGLEKILEISSWATRDLMPDLVFLLDFDPERGLERAGTTDRIEREGLPFHELVRRAYHQLSQRYPERFVIIDGAQAPDEIARQVQEHVAPFLDRAPGKRSPSEVSG